MHSESESVCWIGFCRSIDHLLHVVLVVAEVEVYVGVDAAELDRRPIVRPAEHPKIS